MNTSLNNLFLSANTYQFNISAKIEDHLVVGLMICEGDTSQ